MTGPFDYSGKRFFSKNFVIIQISSVNIDIMYSSSKKTMYCSLSQSYVPTYILLIGIPKYADLHLLI